MPKKPTREERRILEALAWMCEQYLKDGPNTLDDMAMSAGQEALAVLAEYGYVDTDGGGRGGRWTEAGRALLDRA